MLSKAISAQVLRTRFSRVLATVQHGPLRGASHNAQQRNGQQCNGGASSAHPIAVACAAALCGGIAYTVYRKQHSPLYNVAYASTEGKNRSFTLEEISKHNNEQAGVWVTYENQVFDVTEFLEGHPGGKKMLLLAAGGPLEPFWNALPVHKSPEVREMLDEFLIGEIHQSDRAKLEQIIKEKDAHARAYEQYAHEPSRSEQLHVVNERPFNAETPESSMAKDFFTPNKLFFVRNHLGVPEVNVNKYQLVVEVDRSLYEAVKKQRAANVQVADKVCQERDSVELSSVDYVTLKSQYSSHEVISALMCSGNRRSEMHQVEPVKGLMWRTGAVSNARWTGVLLSDVIEHLTGCSLEQLAAAGVQHLQFVGADRDIAGSGAQYGASIPLTLARGRRDAVLLAYQMNGEPLPADHGFPVRVLVPGVTGARSVKWLVRVRLSASESDSIWQRNDYKVLPGWMTFERNNLDFTVAPPIYDTPVTSAICSPLADAHVAPQVGPDGAFLVPVAGFALSGGGRSISRVEVSADGGLTWQPTTLTQASAGAVAAPDYSWTQWHADVRLSVLPADGRLQLLCRATDNSYNVQPETARAVWNVRGLLNNAYHQRTVFITSCNK